MRPFDEAAFAETSYVRMPSLGEAIAAVMRDHGAHVRMNVTSSMTALLVSDTDKAPQVTHRHARERLREHGDDLWYSFVTTISDTHAWDAAQAWDAHGVAVDATVNEERHFLLKDALSDLDVGRCARLVDYITGTAWQDALFSPDRYVEAMRDLAVGVWWERRMAEGHTPGPDGSARLLLALLVPPTLLCSLAYSPQGAPAFIPRRTQSE